MQDPAFAIDDTTYEEASIQQLQRSPMASIHSFANFQGFIDANIKTLVHANEDANKFLKQLWNNFEVMADGFDQLIDIISTDKPSHSASDGSVLSDGRASTGRIFWRPAAKFDADACVEEEDFEREVKVLFRRMILVDGSLEEMSSYRSEAMGTQ